MVKAKRSDQISFEVYVKIQELSKKGLSSVEIAHNLGLHEFDVVEALLSEFSELSKNESLKRVQKRIKNEIKKEPALRDVQILEYRKQGLTLDEIGNLMGVTRERIRQIIKSLGVEIDLEQIKQQREKAILSEHSAENMKIFNSICENWDEFKAKNIRSIALEFGISESRLAKCISRIQYVYLKANQDYTISKSWTDSQCIISLVNASTYAFPLTVLRYRQLLDERTIDGPTVAIFIQRFGSWVNACTLAGVEYGEALREYDRTWSDNELLGFVRRFMHQREDGRWSIEKYEDWRKRPEVDGPSVGLLRLYLGTWSEIRVLAIELHAPEFDMHKFSELRSDEKRS
jgi:transcriptional regulator